jgi:hypothetical protein
LAAVLEEVMVLGALARVAAERMRMGLLDLVQRLKGLMEAMDMLAARMLPAAAAARAARAETRQFRLAAMAG